MKISAQAIPVKVKRAKTEDALGIERGTALEITWSTGEVISYRSDFLRKYCPCADCAVIKNKPKKPVSRFNVITATEEEAVNLKKVWVVGNYALGIQWGDDHNAGIYTYTLLKELADIVRING